jgi:hypothetical protein
MVRADYRVYLATEAGADPATWEEISDYVLSMAWSYGRDDWLSQLQPGTSRIVVRNDDGRFFTERTDSPLYPNVDDMRAIKAECTFLGNTEPLFFGYVQSVLPDPSYESRRAVITMADASCWLELADVSPAYADAPTGTNLGTLLDAADWPAALRDLDAGQTSGLPTYAGSDAKSQAQRIAVDNEGGLFYFDPSGNAKFEDRHYRLTGSALVSQGTFTYLRNLIPEAPARDIRNQITVNYDGGSITRSDAASAAAYGPRQFDINGDFLDLAEATNRADYTLSQRKDRHPRPIASLQAATDVLRAAILARTLSERITLDDGDDTGLEGDYYIERVEQSVDMASQEHNCAWQLSPATNSAYWLLGIPGYSELGITTRLGY